MSVTLAFDYLCSRIKARADRLVMCLGVEVPARWCRPRVSQLKCNVGAAIFEQSNSMGIGMLLRDADGGFVAIGLLYCQEFFK